jgi:hypothetical protein
LWCGKLSLWTGLSWPSFVTSLWPDASIDEHSLELEELLVGKRARKLVDDNPFGRRIGDAIVGFLEAGCVPMPRVAIVLVRSDTLRVGT